MKNKMLLAILLAVSLSLQLGDLSAQCVLESGTNLEIGSGNDIMGDFVEECVGNAIGFSNKVKSLYSLAVGANDTITTGSSYSVALGSSNAITGGVSMAFGRLVKVTGDDNIGIGNNIRVTSARGGMVIGSGINGSGGAYLVNSTSNSLMVGFNSAKPTLFVSTSPNSGSTTKTGKVAIGDVTPQAKLHIRSDDGEDAGIIIAPAVPTSDNTFIRMRDNYHHITVNGKGVMEISSSDNYPLHVTSRHFNLSESMLELGVPNEERPFSLSSKQSTPSFGSNAVPSGVGYIRRANGPSYVMEFGPNGFLLRTAVYVPPTITTTPPPVISNWRDALSVKTNGAITLTGQVGVNIENTYSNYALAVDGGIISTKVHIQDVNDWQDRVFDEGYRLMSLNEVEAYVAANRHLPGIPSEAEVRAEGFDMAEMASALLGKVEELTLYAIRQQREIDSLKTLVTVSFGYDACGNRTSRTLQFSKADEGRGGGSGDTSDIPDAAGQWEAMLSDSFAGMEAMLFPNPTEGGFFLTLGGGKLPAGATAVLCAVDGTVLEERTLGSATEEFDLSRRPAGIYLLRLTSGDETRVWKVIKRN